MQTCTHPMAYTKRVDADGPWICDAITGADADLRGSYTCGRGLSADTKFADLHTSAQLIQMPFGVVSGVGRGMGVLDGDDDH